MLKNECVICFAGEDWWYFNPHSNLHIMKEFSKNNKVLFVNSTGVRMPNFRKDKYAWKRIFQKLGSMSKYLSRVDPNIYVFTPIAFPSSKRSDGIIGLINQFILILQFNIVLKVLNFKNPILWVCSPSVLNLVIYLKKRAQRVVYYCTDNIRFISGSDDQDTYELSKSVQQISDVSFFVNQDLAMERLSLNERTYHLGHGVDYDLFAKAQSPDQVIPDDIKHIRRPIAGYIGALRGIDFNLVKFLAMKNPAISFVFIGDNYSDLGLFADVSNVHFLGKRPYEKLPAYMHVFDCCCLYYDVNDTFNNYRNPKKFLEYMASGKPIVSVAISEMEHFKPYVNLAKTYDEFNEMIIKAMTLDTQDNIKQRMEYARNQTWESIAERAAELIMSSNQK